ncbi:MAG: hypothetical protein HYZ81_10955, partial [Nitrospinae bacterium]|nr:hypothetical protein [Nitrospinota bacterium]
MFEKTREVVRKDKYGFAEEEFPRRAIIVGSSHAGLSRKELASMAEHDAILPGDIQENPAFDGSKPPAEENPLFTVTVTADLLGGTRNFVCDGTALFLVHGERRYSLRDEGLLRKRALQLGIKAREVEKVVAGLEQRILQVVAEVRARSATPRGE